MSTINSPSLPGAFVPAFSVPLTEKSEPAPTPFSSHVPLYKTGLGQFGNLGTLGIRMPKANGDIAALISQLSLTLQITTGEIDKNRSLSAIASSLRDFGLEALAAAFEQSKANLSRAESRNQAFTADKAEKEQNRAPLDNAIKNMKQQIANLEAAIAVAPPEQKPALQAQLDTLRNSLGQLLQARSSVERDLAELAITALETRKADLTELMRQQEPGSDEYDRLSALRNDVNSRIVTMRQELGAFAAAAPTHAGIRDFTEKVSGELATVKSDLRQDENRAREAKNRAFSQFDQAVTDSIFATALAAAGLRKQESRESPRKQGEADWFDVNIKDLVGQLGNSRMRTDEEQIASDARIKAGREDSTQEKAEAAARLVMQALAELMAEISRQISEPLLPSAPAAAPSAVNRFHFEI